MQNTCEGMEMGLIKVEVLGAVGKYQLKWNGPTNKNETTVQSNLKRGRYVVKVSDEAGCSDSKTFNITSNSKPKVSASYEKSEEKRGLAELEISGKRPYRVQWINSKGKIVGKDPVANRLKEGMYFYTVIDGNNCFVGGSVKVQ